MNHSEFQEMIEDGLHTDDRMSAYILQNVATPTQKQFMADYSFDIAMILNGRIVEDGSIPLQLLDDMVQDWNRELEFECFHVRYV